MTRPHYITPDIEDTLPLFRRTDPATSQAAAATVTTFAGEHHAAILEALSHGPAGASGIAVRCGLASHQVNKRLTELARAGRIVETGRTVRSGSGRGEREWQITPRQPR
jgi:predicted ArsR family transcriptional regulator